MSAPRVLDERTEERIKNIIRTIPDFPKKGILFRDITPLLADGEVFRLCIERFKAMTHGKVDCVVSIESRGFIFGSALAYALGVGFVLVRKEGKLPHHTVSASYSLEYGEARVEMHEDSIRRGSRVLLIDDVLATGGTMRAAVDLVEKLGGIVCGLYFLIELETLAGRNMLTGYNTHSLICY
jgi:adenine phosphoribosyltransferase